jgi:hypothetical protein
MMRRRRKSDQHALPSPQRSLKQPPRIVELPAAVPREGLYRPVAAPRQRVHARPLWRRASPPNVQAPESGDDWREIAREVRQWLKESWQELHNNPRPFFGWIWQWIQKWWEGDE